MKTIPGPEIWQNIVTEKLHMQFLHEAPATAKIETLFRDLGGQVVLDHAATRTPQKKTHELIQRIAKAFALVPQEDYQFPDKHLTAHDLQFSDKSGFKWFSTLVLYNEFSDKVIAAVEEDLKHTDHKLSEKSLSLLEKLEKDQGLSESDANEYVDDLLSTFFVRQGPKLKKSTYDIVAEESSELANALLIGPGFNHVAYLLNDLSIPSWYGTEIIETLNDFLLSHDIRMLPEIQGPIGGMLRQTSTKADIFDFELLDDDGKTVKLQSPGKFLEFIQRGPVKDENGKIVFKDNQIQRFQGFVVTNTEKLYNATQIEKK